MNRKKAIITTIIVAILVAIVVVCIPRVEKRNDGGTVDYKAIAYTITQYHKTNAEYEGGYQEGTRVKIFGKIVVDDCPELD